MGRCRCWLRHCATSRKVVVLIPGGVTGIFHCLNHSGPTVVVGSNQPQTEIGTRDIAWVGGGGGGVNAGGAWG
jgi:hypothetical protein